MRTSQTFDYGRLLATVALCGSPAEVAERIAASGDLLGLDLVALSMDLGGLPRDLLMESIDLIGAEVDPRGADSARSVSTRPGDRDEHGSDRIRPASRRSASS